MRNESNKQAIVWASIMMLVGVLALIQVYVHLNPWIWVAALAVSGVVSLAVYLTDSSARSLLIPAYVTLAVAAFVALAILDVLRGESVAVFALVLIAIPFLAVFLRDGRQWWALIPAYVMAVVALMIGLQEVGVLTDELTAPYILFCIAIPFYVVYARRPKEWPFLIPAGVLTIVGLSLLAAFDVGAYILPIVLIGLGAVMIVQLLRRAHKPAD